MNKNQVLALSLSALISFKDLLNGAVAFASSPNDMSHDNEKSDVIPFLQVENLTFEQFMKGIAINRIPERGMNNLKSLYEETNKLERDERFDEACKKWMEFDKMLDKYLGNDFQSMELSNFEEFMKYMPTKNIPADAMKKLNELYNDTTKLERSNKIDEADKKWDEFYRMLEEYLDNKFESTELPSFEKFMKDMPTRMIPFDYMEKLNDLYNDITRLEKNNKLDEAGEMWDEFYNILEKYLVLNPNYS